MVKRLTNRACDYCNKAAVAITNQLDAEYNVQGCILEGGWEVVSLATHSAGMTVVPFKVCIFEHNQLQGTAMTQTFIWNFGRWRTFPKQRVRDAGCTCNHSARFRRFL